MAELAEHTPQKTDLKNDRTSYVAVCFWLPIFPQRAGRSDSCCVKRSGCLSGDGHRNGKSLCYQIPALCFPGLTLVISPLISLMKDQVDQLQANGIEADFLNSSQTSEQQQQVANKLISGQLKIIICFA